MKMVTKTYEYEIKYEGVIHFADDIDKADWSAGVKEDSFESQIKVDMYEDETCDFYDFNIQLAIHEDLINYLEKVNNRKIDDYEIDIYEINFVDVYEKFIEDSIWDEADRRCEDDI